LRNVASITQSSCQSSSVRSRERDLCFREKEITSSSMKQTSAPGLGGVPGRAPAPLGWTGAYAVCPPGERDRPLFLRKTTWSQPSKQTSDLCFSEKPRHRSLRNKHPSFVSPSSPAFVWRAFTGSPGASAVVCAIGPRQGDRPVPGRCGGVAFPQQRIAATRPMIKRLVVTPPCWSASPGAALAAALLRLGVGIDKSAGIC
jgi:hypothetical protein